MSRVLVCAALVMAFGCGTSAPTAAPGPKEKAAPAPAPPGGTVPAATFPPDDWTHKELAAHLATKGIVMDVSGAPVQSAPGQPASCFRCGTGQSIVYLCADAKTAKEKAGSLGSSAFAAGRFAFGPSAFGAGDDPADLAFLKKLAAALK